MSAVPFVYKATAWKVVSSNLGPRVRQMTAVVSRLYLKGSTLYVSLLLGW